jgi:hypothetical protein
MRPTLKSKISPTIERHSGTNIYPFRNMLVPSQSTLKKFTFDFKMVAGMLSFSICIWWASMLGQETIILEKEKVKLQGQSTLNLIALNVERQ